MNRRHPLILIILSVFASSPAAPAAAIESPAASVARAIEFKPYPTAHITKAQWTTYYEQVQAAYGASLQVITEQRLNVFHGGGVLYAFTRPDHPAHPAWIARKAVQTGHEQSRFMQIGYFAGAEAPFAELFRQYRELTEKTRECLEAAPQKPEGNELLAFMDTCMSS
jgi:hypothetical protein